MELCGRNSLRVLTTRTYQHALVVLDLALACVLDTRHFNLVW